MDGAAKRSVLMLVAGVAMVAGEALRTSGPLIDQMVNVGGVPLAAAVAVVVYGAPALAGPLARWLGPAWAATGAVLALVALRLVVQIEATPSFVTGMITVAVAVVALTYVVWQAVAGSPGGGLHATVGLLLGGVLDIAIRTAFSTWDPVWRPGVWGYLVTVAECLFVVWALAGARHHFAAVGPPAGRIAVVGLVLALGLLIFTSPAYVASQADVGVPTASGVLLAGALLAIETVSRLRLPGGSGRLPQLNGRAAGSIAAVALVAATAAASYLSGPVVAVAIVVGQITVAVLLARALTTARDGITAREPRFALVGLGVGGGFVLVVLPYQAHYEMPLPVPNQLLLLVAAAVIGVAAIGHRPGPDSVAVTELAPQPVTEPVTESVAESTTEPTTEPMTTPTTEQTTAEPADTEPTSSVDEETPTQPSDEDAPARDTATATAPPRPAIPTSKAARRGRFASLAAVPAVALAVPIVMLALTPAPLGPAPATAGDTSTGQPQQFRLMSWNVHYGVNGRAAVALEDIATAIERQRPDVVTLQEVSRGWPLGGGVDQAEWLSRRLRMSYVWSPAADGQFGNVILSRLPMSDGDARRLPRGDGSMGRSYAAVTVELSGGGRIRVVTTHLDHHRDGTPTRLAQLDALLKVWDRTVPTVISGDFNAPPGSPEVTKVTAAGFVSAQDQTGHSSLLTWPTHQPRHRIDWIFGTPELSFSDFARPDIRTSDHFPLTTTIRLG